MTGTARLSYSHGASPDPLLGETIGDNLRRIAAAHPGREVLVDVPTGRRWTYAQFDAAQRFRRPVLRLEVRRDRLESLIKRNRVGERDVVDRHSRRRDNGVAGEAKAGDVRVASGGVRQQVHETPKSVAARRRKTCSMLVSI